MIGKLKGVIDEIAEDHVVIDVHGVGYVAFCSARTLGNLGGAGEAAILFIETYVREDMIRLLVSDRNSSANGFACCRTCRAWVPKWRLACLVP